MTLLSNILRKKTADVNRYFYIEIKAFPIDN